MQISCGGPRLTFTFAVVFCLASVAGSSAVGQSGSLRKLKGSSDILSREQVTPAALASASLLKASPASDYNPETPIKWGDQSELPFSVECFIGFLWVALVGSSPILIITLERESVTKVQIATSCVMWVVFFAGLYLFTNIILFQSSHFHTERSLTIVECVYLMSQILTTVGYGDITPSRPRGQVFVGLYVFFAIMVIANVVSDVTSLVLEHTEAYANKLADAADLAAEARAQQFDKEEEEKGRKTRQVTDSIPESPRAPHIHGPSCVDVTAHFAPIPPPIDWEPMVIAILMFAFFCFVGVVFFVTYPGEGKSVLEGIYMSMITLSTVGFGAVTPNTEAGKVFASFWMLFGTGALVNVITRFTELTVNIKTLERFDPQQSVIDMKSFTEAVHQMPERIDFADFLKGSILKSQLMDAEGLEKLQDMFDTQSVQETRGQEDDNKVHKSFLHSLKASKSGMSLQRLPSNFKCKFSRHRSDSRLQLPKVESMSQIDTGVGSAC